MENPSDANNFFFWWSVISTVVGLLFLGGDIWQLASSKKEKELHKSQLDLHKSQVKLWQHHATGLMQGLTMIQNQFSTVKDVQEAAKISQATALSLHMSLLEDRHFSEAEAKQRHLNLEERIAKQTT